MVLTCTTMTRLFQHTAARRRLESNCLQNFHTNGFNTQPPEGGWFKVFAGWRGSSLFQHTAARRRLGLLVDNAEQTACFNTQPPEGGWKRL